AAASCASWYARFSMPLNPAPGTLFVLREQAPRTAAPCAPAAAGGSGSRDSPSADQSRRTSERSCWSYFAAISCLVLDVQGIAPLLRFCERDQGVLRRSDLSSSPGAQAVEPTEVERANVPKM